MSYILSQILTKKTPQWNQIIWTDEFLVSQCEIFNVRYKEIANHGCKGEYTIYEGQPFILVRKELKHQDKLWIALHEFGHHLLHYPVHHKFSKSIVKRMDREANFFAALSMMPTSLVNAKTFGEILEEYNYPKQIVKIRKEIRDAYPKM